MPILIKKRLVPAKRGSRGKHFDTTVLILAPQINKLWDQGIRTIRGLAKALNAAGIAAPGSRSFDYSKVRRVLKRMRELGLGGGPQSPKIAANHRLRPVEIFALKST